MDQTKNNVVNHSGQVQLWIGNDEKLYEEVFLFLQKNLCPLNGCGQCKICTLIRKKNHHQCLWLSTENQYLIEDIEPVLQKISLLLDINEQFFIIFEQADRLTTACTNRLLKPLEEPQTGYYFILLTEHPNRLLPTIKSRCTISTFVGEEILFSQDPFYLFFSNQKPISPLEFVQLIEKSHLYEHDIREMVEALLTCWHNKQKNLIQKKEPSSETISLEQITQILNLLSRALKRPPMPGSSKLFLKNLYLGFKKITL